MLVAADISDFFDEEAQAAREAHESLMSEPLHVRLRRRKAIAGLRIDAIVQDGYYYKVVLGCSRNHSDFREGDTLVLHPENQRMPAVRCTLTGFSEDDGQIEVQVYFREEMYLRSLCDVPEGKLVLDRDCVDLRPTVFSKFLNCLTDADLHRICDPGAPRFDIGDEPALDSFIRAAAKNLTPRQEEAVRKSFNAVGHYLIQGPPGTGKSTVLGIVIAAEVLLRGRRVLVTGPNHSAINNLLHKTVTMFPQLEGRVFKIGQSYNSPEAPVINVEGMRKSADDAAVIGLTAHAFYTSRAAGLCGDVLVIDEAGQMTVPLAMMAMLNAPKTILCGDHKQLPPVIVSENINPLLLSSAFGLMVRNDNCTLLDQSFRMCGPLCMLVSSLFYEGCVRPVRSGYDKDVICDDPIVSFDSPVVICDVRHMDMQVSESEAGRIASIVTSLVGAGVSPGDIGVLAPFRAQVAQIRRSLRASGVVVDTIDKMQGQERPVIILSMTVGDKEYAEEMKDFLFSPNKLNVAFSRAVSKLIIVGCSETLKENTLFDSIFASGSVIKFLTDERSDCR